jgi:polysaccharide pyruvyl transferase WcaK-like protein
MPQSGPRVCILGGAVDNVNLGVAALGIGSASGLLQAIPSARVIMATGSMRETIRFPVAGVEIETDAINLHYSTRLRDRCGTRFLSTARRSLRYLPARVRAAALACSSRLRYLDETQVFLDITGGDSFTDLYGPGVFEDVIAVKEFLLSTGKPLVLLPQTYGPFQADESKRLAASIIDRAAVIATRESTGVEDIRILCGEQVAKRVVVCPDVSFLMAPIPVPGFESLGLRSGPDDILVGMNISGLLYLGDREFGLRDSYVESVDAMVDWALSDPRRKLVLIPHVYAARHQSADLKDHSDSEAIRLVVRRHAQRDGSRLICLDRTFNAAEAKYLVGQTDFMIGARMHSCIAGVSQGIPTATLAYSKKAMGLMSQLRVPETVIDLRTESRSGCVALLQTLFEQRQSIADRLQAQLPGFKRQVAAFFADFVKPLAEGVQPPVT